MLSIVSVVSSLLFSLLCTYISMSCARSFCKEEEEEEEEEEDFTTKVNKTRRRQR